MSLTEKQIERKRVIVADLIKKRPELNGCTYSEEEYYDHERRYYRKRMIPSVEFFGFDPVELYELSVKGEWTLRDFLRDEYSKGVTNKFNRIDERITAKLSNYIRKIGIPGLYSVSTYNAELGVVCAEDLAQAQRIADVTFGFMIAGKKDRWGDPCTLNVSFSSQGGREKIHSANEITVKRIEKAISRKEEMISEARKEIEELQARLVSIQLSEMSQITAEGDLAS